MTVEVARPAPTVMSRVGALASRLPFAVDVEELLFIRAELNDLGARGRISAGGSCRLLPAADGWVAVNLSRPTDIEAVPAIVEDRGASSDPWAALEAFTATRPAQAAAARCQLLGVPGAVLDDPQVDGTRPVVLRRGGEAAAAPTRPLVVDLSALWAGPLCALLLGHAGLEVVNVESRSRPDGTRTGDARFFEWLHHGQREIVLDLSSGAGREDLRRLIGEAGVVIESTRPRALAQLGIDADEILVEQPGLTWVSLTGYGRTGARAGWVAFGDDAAVAGGLVARDTDGRPAFCGDAIADPLSGLQAAVAALDSQAQGGGHLVAVSMAAVARSVTDPDG